MIAENVANIKSRLPDGVKLVAVSKLKSVDEIMEAYGAGQRAMGENYATELRDKEGSLPKDIEWHFIGHLQSKQLKYYVPFVSMIHGVDSLEHLLEVERVAAKVDRCVDVLLQLHVAEEETKFGFSLSEVHDPCLAQRFEHVRIRGVMGMATHTDDVGRIRQDFRTIRSVFDQLRVGVFVGREEFDTVSMGMSHDWPIAVDEGSTLVRIGTGIFGERDYSKKLNII